MQLKSGSCGHGLWLLPAFAGLLLAGDVSWRDKAARDWNVEDARQVLTESPWARTVIGSISRLETEDERRTGGKMGQDHGVGFDGVDGNKSKSKAAADYFTAGPGGATIPRTEVRLQVRWESALPVRLAEIKAGVVEPPVLPGDGYRLAVYGVPGTYFRDDPKKLGEPLKKGAVLKREGKMNVMPSAVEVFQREDGLVVVYLFPLSAEISSRDGLIRFEAHIGRVGFTQYFDTAQMQYQNKLEL